MSGAGFAIVNLANLANLGFRRNLDPPGEGGFPGFGPGFGRIQIIGDFRRPKAGDCPSFGHFPGFGAEI